jgi:hypothetical protein
MMEESAAERVQEEEKQQQEASLSANNGHTHAIPSGPDPGA